MVGLDYLKYNRCLGTENTNLARPHEVLLIHCSPSITCLKFKHPKPSDLHYDSAQSGYTPFWLLFLRKEDCNNIFRQDYNILGLRWYYVISVV